MPVLTLNNIQALVAAYVADAKITVDKANYAVTRESISELAIKIGKQLMLDSEFRTILPELEGETLNYGTTMEEYFVQLQLAVDYDPDGTTALAPKRPVFKDPFYHELLGRKTIPVTVDDTEFQKAMLSDNDHIKLVAKLVKILWDSYELHKNQVKRQLLGRLGEKVIASGLATQKIPMAKPTDNATGEAFTKEVKELYTELTVFENDKYNMANVIAISPEVNLYVAGSDVLPVIDVDVLAGAFNKDKAQVPVPIRQVKDFGVHGIDAGIWAMLIDPRGAKIHPHQITSTSEHNAEGEFTTYYIHFSITAFISPFTNAVVFTTTGA